MARTIVSGCGRLFVRRCFVLFCCVLREDTRDRQVGKRVKQWGKSLMTKNFHAKAAKKATTQRRP